MAIQHPQFDPVAISLGPFAIHWYGLMYLLSFIVGWGAAVYRTRLPHVHWTKDDISDFLFYVVLGVVLGGRIGYMLFYQPQILLSDPLEILQIWNGGMSFHGGMLGVFLACWWYGRKTNRTFFDVTDFVAPVIPIGLFFGRIANFINAELVGRVTDVPWAMIYAQVDGLARHPSQIYQATLEGPVFLAILWWFARKSRPRMAVSGVFMLSYGCLRFFSEFFRQPDAHLGFIAFDWLTMGQALCLPMIATGVLLLALAYGRGESAREQKA